MAEKRKAPHGRIIVQPGFELTGAELRENPNASLLNWRHQGESLSKQHKESPVYDFYEYVLLANQGELNKLKKNPPVCGDCGDKYFLKESTSKIIFIG